MRETRISGNVAHAEIKRVTCRESGVQPARVLKEMKPAAVRLHLAEVVTGLDDYVACEAGTRSVSERLPTKAHPLRRTHDHSPLSTLDRLHSWQGTSSSVVVDWAECPR